MRTIIAGSRNCNHYQILLDAVAQSGAKITTVICGTADGADTLGEVYAALNGIPCERYPANWKDLGKRAGYVRNQQMCDVADTCIVLWDGESRGSKHMIDIAVKASYSDNASMQVGQVYTHMFKPEDYNQCMSTFIINSYSSTYHPRELLGDSLEDLITNATLNTTKEELLKYVETANAQYRAGHATIADKLYDVLLSILKVRYPDCEYLKKVEPEVITKGVKLPSPMLSIDKCYTHDEIKLWLARVKKAAAACNIAEKDINIVVSAKLDGVATCLDDTSYTKSTFNDFSLYTRGDGEIGNNISHLLHYDKPICILHARQHFDIGYFQCLAELVVSKAYFKTSGLCEVYSDPRSCAVAALQTNPPDVIHEAIACGGIILYPYINLLRKDFQPDFLIDKDDFITIIEHYLNDYTLDYQVDGVVLEVTNPQIMLAMGRTKNAHNWRVAYKVNKVGVEAIISDIVPTIGRTGRINPTLIVEPVECGSITVNRVNAHNYNFVKRKQLSPGTVINITRGGEVVPKFLNVVRTCGELDMVDIIPDKCPVCSSEVIWKGKNLKCANLSCTGVTIAKLAYFFKRIGAEGFGQGVISKLVKSGIIAPTTILIMDTNQFIKAGITPGIAKNLKDELTRISKEPMADWVVLTALSIDGLTESTCMDMCKKYDVVYKLDDFDNLSDNPDATALRKITNCMAWRWILSTKTLNVQSTYNATVMRNGVGVVLTGTFMVHRNELKDALRNKGISVYGHLNRNVTHMVVGHAPSIQKVALAEKMGIKILSEHALNVVLNSDLSNITDIGEF